MILYSTHVTGDIETIADRYLFLNQGEIVAMESADELLEHSGLANSLGQSWRLEDIYRHYQQYHSHESQENQL